MGLLLESKLFAFYLNAAFDTGLNRCAGGGVDQCCTIVVLVDLGPIAKLFILPDRCPGLVSQIPQLLFESDLLSSLLVPFTPFKLLI